MKLDLKKRLDDLRTDTRWRMAMFIATGVSFVVFLIIFILSLTYILGGLSSKSSVHFEERNSIDCKVYLNDADKDEYTEPQRKKDNDGYFLNGSTTGYALGHTKFIRITPSYSADLSKKIDVKYTVAYSMTLNIYSTGSNKQLLNYQDVTKTLNANGAVPKDDVAGNGEVRINGFSYDFNLEDYIALVEKYAASVKNFNVTGEIVFTATYQLSNSPRKIKTASYPRGMTIQLNQLEKNPFVIAFSGKGGVEADIPERAARMPGFGLSVLIVIGLAVPVTGMFLALREIYGEKNVYAKAIKNIKRKYGDALVAANNPIVQNWICAPVKNFNELMKLALNLSKPITYWEEEDKTVFFILCDSIRYQFELLKK